MKYPTASSAQGGGGTRPARMPAPSKGSVQHKGTMSGGDTTRHKGTMGDGRSTPTAKGHI
jgi:hypothetical protein